MSFYDDAIQAGKQPENVRDYVLEQTSDFISQAKQQGKSDSNIMEYISNQTGVPMNILYPDNSTQNDTNTMQKTEISTATPEIMTKDKLDSMLLDLDKRTQDSKARLQQSIQEHPELADVLNNSLSKIDEVMMKKANDISSQYLKGLKIQDEINKQNQFKEQTKDLGAVNRTVQGISEAQGGLRLNVLVPMAQYLGWNDTAKELTQKGTNQIAIAKDIEQRFKEAYGEDAWNIAQEAGNLTPNVIGAIVAGARKTPQAIAEGVITYAKTGSLADAAQSATLTFLGGALADKLFALKGGITNTKFGNEIAKLPSDKQKDVNMALDALEQSGINKLDDFARQQILQKIDLSQGTEYITKQVKTEINSLNNQAYKGVEDAYNSAKAIGSQTSKETSSDISKELMNSQVFLNAKKGSEIDAQKNILDTLSKPVYSKMNATTMEDLIQELGEDGASHYGTSAGRMYKEAVDLLKSKQEALLGQGDKDVFNDARELYKDYNRKFTGKVEGQASETGAKIQKATISSDYTMNIGNKLLTNGIDAETAKNLADIGLSQSSKTSLVKDVLTKGLDTQDLANERAVKTIISRFNNFDVDGLKMLLGNDYKVMNEQMKGLEMIQNTLSQAPIENDLKKRIIDLAVNASLIKVSPLYAVKQTANDARGIAMDIALKKERNEVLKRTQMIKDRPTANKLMKAIVSTTSGKLSE